MSDPTEVPNETKEAIWRRFGLRLPLWFILSLSLVGLLLAAVGLVLLLVLWSSAGTLGDEAASLGGVWYAIALVLLAAALGAAYLGYIVARPIVGTSKVARNLGEFRAPLGLDVPDSIISELHHAAAAFNAMARDFRMMEAYIPTAMLRRLKQSGADEAEKRVVTVMYSDISNFTRLADFMSAHETAAFLNQHFALVTECVEAEDGTVDKIVGDGVIAFWGAPTEQPDHARRAARAAFAVAEAIRYENDLRREQGQSPVQVKIGLHSGEVIAAKVGAAGRLAYTIIGETVNLAQRIQELCKQVAGPDDDAIILAGAATADALGPEYSPAPAGSHVAPGSADTVDVFRLD